MITGLDPFLAFTGQAREALAHYLAVLPDCELREEHLYGPDEEGAAGTVRFARLQVAGKNLRVIDVPEIAEFRMTSGVSVFLTCDTAVDVDRLSAALGDGGSTMMAADAYPFADRFAWVEDRFGVNWQIMYGHRLEDT